MPYPDQIPDSTMAEIRNRLGIDNEQRVVENGESAQDRSQVTSGIAQASQGLTFSGFTARVTQNISQIRVVTTGTAAAATPTLCRLGVYQRDTPTVGTYTLVASTVNDTTLFAAANTTYTRSFSAPFLKLAGVDYLVAYLIVTGVAMPSFCAPTATNAPTAYLTDVMLVQPFASGRIAGQADLPASFLASSVIVSAGVFHALLLQ
jgi:hypothetical protein